MKRRQRQRQRLLKNYHQNHQNQKRHNPQLDLSLGFIRNTTRHNHTISNHGRTPDRTILNHGHTILNNVRTISNHGHTILNNGHTTSTNNTNNNNNSLNIYHGVDIHAYTPDIIQSIHSHQNQIVSKWGDSIHPRVFHQIIQELKEFYGPKLALQNFVQNFRPQDGWIRDPQVPQLNSAILLEAIWFTLKKLNETSIYRHFEETLDQIGTTCIQGISHRLFMDYLSIVVPVEPLLEEKEKEKEEQKTKNSKQ